MKQFQVINREYIPEFNLELYGNMLEKRSTLHNEAVKANSELKNTIAQLNLNEAEDGFRAKLIADVQKTLTENASLGDYAASYDDMIRVSGDIVSNPALISKLKAQQDYQTFQAKIDARTDLPQHYKDYFKAQNKYYEGEYDANGNWIKGTKWEPTKTAAVRVDTDKIWEEALKRISPDKGTFPIYTWIDANRNIVDKYHPNAKLVRYNTATYTYEEVKKEDIKAAIDEVIKANPIYMDSLKQDWEIAKYDLLHGNIDAVFDVNNGTGGPITFNQFVDRLFDESARTKAYRYTEWKKDDVNEVYDKQLAALYGGNSNKDLLPNSPYTSSGESSVYVDNSNIKNFALVRKGNDELKSKLSSYNLPSNIKNNMTLDNPDGVEQELNNAISQNLITKEEADSIRNEYNALRILYKEELHNRKVFRENNNGTKGYDAEEFKADRMYGEFKSENERSNFYNRLNREWDNINDGLFGKDGDSIYVNFGTSAAFDLFKKYIKEAGLDDTFNNDGELVSKSKVRYSGNGFYFDRTNNSYLPEISELYLRAIKEAYAGKPLQKLWNRTRDELRHNHLNAHGDSIYRINSDGSSENLVGLGDNSLSNIPYTDESASRNIFGKIINYVPALNDIQDLYSRGLIYDSRDVFAPIIRFEDRLARYSEKDNIAKNVPVENRSFDAGTIEGIKADTAIQRGTYEDIKDYNHKVKVKDQSKIDSFNQVKIAGLRNLYVEEQDENGLMQRVLNNDHLDKLNKALISANPGDDENTCTIEYNEARGRYVYKLKFNEKVKNGEYKSHVLYVDDIDNNYLADLNNNPILKSYKKISDSRITGKDIFIGSYMGVDLYANPLPNGMFRITDDSLSEDFGIINDINQPYFENILYYNDIIRSAIENGTDVTSNFYPYCTTMMQLLNVSKEDTSGIKEIVKGALLNMNTMLDDKQINIIVDKLKQ